MNLVAVLPLLLQDKTAEDAFRKIEEALEKAKTVSVKFKAEGVMLEGGMETSKVESSGSLLLKTGNKVNLEMKLSIEGQKLTETILSDGSNAKWRYQRGDPGGGAAPRNLHANLIVGLCRAGLVSTIEVVSSGVGLERELNPLVEVYDLKAGEPDQTVGLLSYKIRFKDTGRTADCNLTYDRRSYRLLKREVSHKAENTELKFIEIYEEFVLDAEIPNEKFKLADDGKEKVELTKLLVTQMSQALEIFKLDHNRYPDRLEDLVTMPKYIEAKKWPPGG